MVLWCKSTLNFIKSHDNVDQRRRFVSNPGKLINPTMFCAAMIIKMCFKR